MIDFNYLYDIKKDKISCNNIGIPYTTRTVSRLFGIKIDDKYIKKLFRPDIFLFQFVPKSRFIKYIKNISNLFEFINIKDKEKITNLDIEKIELKKYGIKCHSLKFYDMDTVTIKTGNFIYCKEITTTNFTFNKEKYGIFYSRVLEERNRIVISLEDRYNNRCI